MKLNTPSEFNQIKIVATFEFLKFVRGKKLFSMLALTLAIPILLVSLQESFDFPEPGDVEIYLFDILNSIFFVQIIVVAFFGSGILVSEFHGKTGFLLFPNPVRRTTIWFGKFLAAEISTFLALGVFYGVISISALSKYSTLPNEILASLFLSFLVTSAMMCISFLISSTFRGPTSALVIMIILFIVVLPIVDQMLMTFGDVKPIFTPTFSSGIISNILKVPYPTDLQDGQLPRGPFDTDIYVPYLSESILIFCIYIFSTGFLSILFFKRRQMN